MLLIKVEDSKTSRTYIIKSNMSLMVDLKNHKIVMMDINQSFNISQIVEIEYKEDNDNDLAIYLQDLLKIS